MSPSAVAGPPHSQPTLPNRGGPVNVPDGAKFSAAGGRKGPERVFPHLDDITAAKPDIDINISLRRVLQYGETCAKQADANLDFRRPDLALAEYFKAHIVTVEMIPRHRDYPSLRTDRGELHQQHIGLMKRINAQHEKFEAVKEIIKENNARNGVVPMSQQTKVAETSNKTASGPVANGHMRSKSVQEPVLNGVSSTESSRGKEGINGASSGETLVRRSNDLPTRSKPPVHPKPDALHGNIIGTPGQSTGVQEDLAARLARLRAPAPATPVVQDPRIKTRPIPLPPGSDLASKLNGPASGYGTKTVSLTNTSSSVRSKPAGPREMPSAPSGSLRSLRTEIPPMPRPPDAIYSPARSSDTAATLNLLSSTPRGSTHVVMERHNSVSSFSNDRRSSTSVEDDYFSLPSTSHSRGDSIQSSALRPPEVVDLPNADVITAEELMGYLNKGSQAVRILLVDVRPRDQFDNGHILSQSIICIEPISLRLNMSAEELGESIVLSPDSEQKLFEQRHEFHLIVYYDQSSTSAESSSYYDGASPLSIFSKAIYDYGYEKQTKRRPVLLQGGLDEWEALLGSGSLQTSHTNGITSKPTKSQPKTMLSRQPRRPTYGYKMKYESRVLSREEESKWDAVLSEDSSAQTAAALEAESDAQYIRTTEDFFRRFPEPSAIKESMTVPTPLPVIPVPDVIPKVPTRPAPAVPRQSFTGISDKNETGLHSVPTAISSRPMQPQIETISTTAVIPGLTGLSNEGNTCYMNVAVQCLSATPDIATFLTRFHYPPPVRIPRKSTETTEPPQLMIRNFGNLLRHLWSGHYNYVTPKTFANYVYLIDGQRSTRKDDRTEAFGGNKRQHDSAEFLEFLLEILHDELNMNRNIPPYNKTPKEKEYRDLQPIMDAAVIEWETFLRSDDSLISRQFMGEYVVITKCTVCQRDSRYWQPFTTLQVPIYDGRRQTIIEAIQDQYAKPEEISEYRCDRCGRDTPAIQYRLFSRLPNYLILQLMRFHDPARKITTLITFPSQNLDMEPMFVPHDENGLQRLDIPSLKYDCYGVIQHIGQGIGSGHYITTINHFRKGRPSPDWWRYNDRMVSKAHWQDTQTKEASVLFYKRQEP